ncbi:MAG: SUMF1/EgtB/PvdO family nonheme iron enzyme [Alphaproteobacteria bacterium]|nr:SUMF1/EgtB/PvdO family nonheme iron enzyme [Alphaproteobacteria bacterium]
MGFDDLLDRLVPGAGGEGVEHPDAPAFPADLGLRVVELIARGGTGWVYRAHDPLLDREVAVKIARPDGGAAAREALLREARTAARLAHPAVLPVHRIAAAGGLLCLELRLAPRTTLAQRLARTTRDHGDWPLARRLAQARVLVDAVARAHELGLVHGDLHPGNVALADSGDPFLLDWGSAEGGESEPAHAAPERLRGEPPTSAGDVWSLGALLWEVVALRPLRVRMGDATLGEHLASWREQAAPRLSTLVTVDTELDALVAAALAPDPRGRPTADELGRRLDAVLTGAAEEARRRAAATERMDTSRHALESYRELDRRAQQERQVAVVLASRVPGHAPIEQKRPAWEAEERARALQEESLDEWITAAESATVAAALLPDEPEPRALQAEAWWERLRRGEQNQDPAEVAVSTARVLRYDDGRYGRQLSAPATVSLDASAPGATAEVFRFVPRDGRLFPEPVERVRLPLERHPLPPGSYLLEIQAEGMATARVPLLLERMQHQRSTIRLYRPEEVGADFCQVPAGPFRMGGDPRARQPLDPCSPSIGDRFVMRTCVRSVDWLSFLDDLDLEAARRHVPGEVGLFGGERGFFQHDGERWHLPPGWEPDWPITAIDLSDAQAYASWFGERHGRPVRLLTEEEWEKAARGVDGRSYPWGDGFDPTYAHMRRSRPGAPRPWPVGRYPVDTSVYGVKDLAGGMREWTASMFDEGQMVLRGGTWGDDADDLRCACRSGVQPGFRYSFVSFRLVSEVPAPIGAA